jgi:hypothetical protein
VEAVFRYAVTRACGRDGPVEEADRLQGADCAAHPGFREIEAGMLGQRATVDREGTRDTPWNAPEPRQEHR